MPDPSSTLSLALKEWATVVQALETGQQVLLFRKGGVKEVDDEFVIEQNRFLLYPTYEHQDASLVKPEFQSLVDETVRDRPGRLVRISSFADVAGITLVHDRAAAEHFYNRHIWNQQYVDMRLSYKPEKPLYVIALQVHLLATPIELPERSEYIGCRSWVNLIEAVPISSAAPVLRE